ncbi:hypothetical protein [Cryptosporangium japonicum]|uniref:Lipocalin-like domain-containing protein n=1 Tax=Cryptosporangium japonicum TaxID=80872 RepID=A0ABN0U623_9ACTN
MIREFGQLSGVVGRRAALRYAGLGLAAAALGACGVELPGSSPRATMIGAFVKGTWKVSAEGGTGVLTIGDGTWDLAAGTPPPGRDHGLLTDAMTGTYRIDAGVLTVEVDGDGARHRGTAIALPTEVSDRADFSATWSYRSDAFTVPVAWDGTTLVVQIVHQRHGGLILYTAERAR